MKVRRISGYALCKGTPLSYPPAYFRLRPGALLEWVP